MSSSFFIPRRIRVSLANHDTVEFAFSQLLLLLLFGVSCARPGESEDSLSVQRPQPHTTNTWKEEKDKIVGVKKERADQANMKTLGALETQIYVLRIGGPNTDPWGMPLLELPLMLFH